MKTALYRKTLATKRKNCGAWADKAGNGKAQLFILCINQRKLLLAAAVTSEPKHIRTQGEKSGNARDPASASGAAIRYGGLLLVEKH